MIIYYENLLDRKLLMQLQHYLRCSSNSSNLSIFKNDTTQTDKPNAYMFFKWEKTHREESIS